MARMVLTGVKEIERMLRRLSDKQGDRIAKATISAGLTVLTKEIRAAAPVGETKALRKSIGRRISSKTAKKYEAKAGINVGKRTTESKRKPGTRILKRRNAKQARRTGKSALAPHGHLVALGTMPRHRNNIGGKFGYLASPTQSQLSTGVMPANNFVKRATNSSRGKVKAAMAAAAKRGLEREAERARRKGRK